ncbi:MAG: protein kinase [Anaerolineae bacterium]
MADDETNLPETIGRYVINDEIGRGGMATVYNATDPQFGRNVAVKVLPREFTHNPHFKERFEREAQAIAQLEHSAIVPVYDYGEDDGRAFLVMRLMQGGTLADRINAGALDPEDIADILDQVAAALDVAHKRGIIHRDVKPGNVLFDEHGDAFISDFGLVKIGETASSLTGSMIVGTPAYMAPEMSQAGGLTSLVDVYALGVTLYQILTGELPYQADTPLGTMLAHAVEPIPDIMQTRPETDPAVARVVRQGMSKQPANRYQTAKQIAVDFRSALEGKPLQFQYEENAGATKQIPSQDYKERAAAHAAQQAAAAPAERREGLPLPVILGIIGAVAAVIIVVMVVANPFAQASVAEEPTVEPTEEPVSEEEPTDEPAVEVEDTQEPEPTDEPTEEPTAVPSAAVGGGGDFVAFHSNETGNFDIYIVSLDGTEQRRLTEDVANDTTPTWSPDGERIAFVSRRSGNLDIYVVEVDSGAITQLTDDPGCDFDPAWSPDGERIAFVSARDGNYEIYVMDADGDNQERLTTNIVSDLSPSWSPDGSQLAITSYQAGNGDIFIINAQTGTIRDQITEDNREDLTPAWSPDGQYIAFASNRDNDWDIYLYEVETGELTNLTDNTAYAANPAWSPDGEWITFASGEAYQVEQGIARIRVDGSEQEIMTFVTSAFFAEFPVWQPTPAD